MWNPILFIHLELIRAAFPKSSVSLKAGIHYTNFAQIFALICNLDELMIVSESQSQSADSG